MLPELPLDSLLAPDLDLATSHRTAVHLVYTRHDTSALKNGGTSSFALGCVAAAADQLGGLRLRADNMRAVSLARRLGFQVSLDQIEHTVHKKVNSAQKKTRLRRCEHESVLGYSQATRIKGLLPTQQPTAGRLLFFFSSKRGYVWLGLGWLLTRKAPLLKHGCAHAAHRYST